MAQTSRASSRVAQVGGQARSILRGDLEKISLATLLTIVDMERRSGMLLVERERQLGRLFFREGRVVRARIEGARRPAAPTSGPEAVYYALSWPDGQFELWQAAIEGRDEIRCSTTFLLMEGARRCDEARLGAAARQEGAGGERRRAEDGGQDGDLSVEDVAVQF